MTEAEVLAAVNTKIDDSLKNYRELDHQQHVRFETLIKNNYKNLCTSITDTRQVLTDSINEIKENLKTLQLSDKDQEIAIAKLKAYAENLKTELDDFRESEKTYGRQMAAEISKLKNIPLKVAGIFIAAMGVLVAAGALAVNIIQR